MATKVIKLVTHILDGVTIHVIGTFIVDLLKRMVI
jgi:hypothetical protein